MSSSAMLEALAGLLTSLGLYSLLVVIGGWLWYQWSHRELLKIAAKIPVSKPTVPLLGHAYLTLRGMEGTGYCLLKMTLGAIEKGIKTVCYWAGPVPLICVQDMDDIQIILNGSNVSDKADEYDLFISGLDSGVGPFKKSILSARGSVWKAIRKHLNPMFHPRNVQQLLPVFNANSRELVERISHHLGRGPFNVMEYTMNVGLKTLCNLVFGPKVTIDVNDEAFKDLLFFVETIPEMFVLRLFSPWFRPDFMFRFFYKNKIKELNNRWKNFTETPLKVARDFQKPKKPMENNFNENELNENSLTEESQEPINLFDVYTILQQTHPEFTEADLIGEILTLYCTGTDTIGTTTASCLLALAQYQDIQDRLYREICSVVGPDDDVTLEDLSRMPYLDMVLKESLRRFIIVPMVLRKLTKEVTLSECKMPAGTPILCTLAAMHMDPNIYPNPTKFDPERFAPENSAGKEKFAYVPFSAGPRICIAKTYAIQLTKISLIHVLRKYRLSTTQDINNLKMKLIVILVCTEGYNISLERRNPDKLLVEND